MDRKILNSNDRRVLLVSINARYSHSSPAIYYLKQSLKNIGFIPEVVEFTIKTDIDKVVEDINSYGIKWVGISVYIWNSEVVKSLLSKLKDSNLSIILGGPEVSYSYDDWLASYPFVKHIVSSYGERSLQEIVKNGFDDKVVSLEYDFSCSPFIYDGVDMGSEFKHKLLYYETSRGCLFRCSYCLSSRSTDNFDPKPVDIIKSELKQIIDSGYQGTLKFIDRTFNYPKGRAGEIWSFLAKHYREGITFHFEIHPTLVTDSDFDILKMIPKDYFRMEVGIQSLNPETLKAISRSPYKKSDIETIQRLANLKNIHVHLDMIVGLPLEDFNSAINTFNTIYDMRGDHFQVGFLKILSGTKMSDEVSRYGIIYEDKAPYEIIENSVISKDEVAIFKRVEDLVERIYNSHKFKFTEPYLLSLSDNSFDLYQRLSHYCRFSAGITWEDSAKSIVLFISENYPDHLRAIIKLLLFDWYSKGMFRHKPKFLDLDVVRFSKELKSKFRCEDGVIVEDQLIYKRGKEIIFADNS